KARRLLDFGPARGRGVRRPRRRAIAGRPRSYGPVPTGRQLILGVSVEWLSSASSQSPERGGAPSAERSQALLIPPRQSACGCFAIAAGLGCDSSRSRLVIRTIGLARASAKIALANLVYNFNRFAWLEGQALPP